jgi:hypothetical protein
MLRITACRLRAGAIETAWSGSLSRLRALIATESHLMTRFRQGFAMRASLPLRLCAHFLLRNILGSFCHQMSQNFSFPKACADRGTDIY